MGSGAQERRARSAYACFASQPPFKPKGAGCSRRPSCAHDIEISVVIACPRTLLPAT
jgi:hypothetical protein